MSYSFPLVFDDFLHSAARKRWSDVQEWLDKVDTLCPKRSGKKSTRNSSHAHNVSVQTVELIELMKTSEELHVSFPEELKRLQEVCLFCSSPLF
jgi:nicotinic acid mononucleotide adenylyltransferase